MTGKQHGVNYYLDSEQKRLLAELCEAARGVPRAELEEFMVIRAFGGDQLQGNGIEREVLFQDLIALDDAGLIRVLNHHRRGTGFNFSISGEGMRWFDEQQGEAIGTEDQVVDSTPNVQPPPTEDSAEEPEGSDVEVDPRAVMVVHGRDEAARLAMFTFLRRLGLKPLDWGELIASTGQAAPYIGEVLDQAFSEAKAVVVLLTPDDEVRLRPGLHRDEEDSFEVETTLQARPNVLFEAGMALALHPTRTIFVEHGSLKSFSDLHGRHTVRLTNQPKALRDLKQRLEKAGCEVEPMAEDWDDPTLFPEPHREVPQASPALPALQQTTGIERKIGYLNEDVNRWIADRDRELDIATKQRSAEMNANGTFHSGAHVNGLAHLHREALHQYRDEISSKRREYAELISEVPESEELPSLQLSEESRAILSRWRGPVTVPGVSGQGQVDDPTDQAKEPDLRRFEVGGDTPS